MKISPYTFFFLLATVLFASCKHDPVEPEAEPVPPTMGTLRLGDRAGVGVGHLAC
ncbi:MAG: hypothetical protein R2818_11560 [Flavobacteriales bacterium]